jgi:DnaJ-domain-containing protein 1
MVLVGFREVIATVGVALAVLLFAAKFGLLKRTGVRFLEEFRKALRGSDEGVRGEKKGADDDTDKEVCYQLLGVTASATQAEIREAYRKKAKQHHPDKGGDPDMMRAITEAYRRLSEKR